LSGCPVEELSLQFVPCITDAGIRKIVDDFPSIKKLNLNGCSNVTPDTLQYINKVLQQRSGVHPIPTDLVEQFVKAKIEEIKLERFLNQLEKKEEIDTTSSIDEPYQNDAKLLVVYASTTGSTAAR
jgi:hypothetical protein